MSKVSQPMAAESSSPFASGVPAQLGEHAPDTVIRGGDEPPISSLLDKQERVGIGRDSAGVPPTSVSFVIPQTPKGKSRHRTVALLRCGKCQRQCQGARSECPTCSNKGLFFVANMSYSDSDQAEYERFAALCAQQGMRGRDKFSGPTRVECRFWLGIPASRVKKLKDGDWHTQRPDTDNCVKSVWDAMNKVCFADDCVVVSMTAEKRWTSGIPRTEVVISSL